MSEHFLQGRVVASTRPVRPLSARLGGWWWILRLIPILTLAAGVTSGQTSQANPGESSPPSAAVSGTGDASNPVPAPSQVPDVPSQPEGMRSGVGVEPPVPTPGPAPGSAASTPQRSPAHMLLLPSSEPIFGGNDSTLELVVLDARGVPILGLAPSGNVDRGRILSIEERSPGYYAVRYRPGVVTRVERATLSLSLPGLPEPFGARFELQVRPIDAGALSLELSRPQLLLGPDATLDFVVRGRRADGLPITVEDISLRSSVGRLERIRQKEPGVVEGTFVPDGKNAPQHVLIAVFSGEGEQLRADWRPLSLIAPVQVPLETEPGAMVLADLAGRSYGPFTVGSSGMIKVPVQVPPGAGRMLLKVTDRVGNVSRSSIDLSVPRSPRTLLYLDREVARVDETRPVMVVTVTVDERGKALPLEAGAVRVRAGRLGGSVELAPGLHLLAYQPPRVPGRQELSLVLNLGEGGEERQSMSLEVREGVAARLEMSVKPAVMRTDDPPAEVSLSVFDQEGNPASSLEPELTVDVGTLSPLRRIGPGEFVAAYRAPRNLDASRVDDTGKLEVTLKARLQRRLGEGPAERILISGGDQLVLVGDEVVFRVSALNLWGAPVAAVPLEARLESGDGQLSWGGSTGAEGEASLRYVAGTKPGPVRIRLAHPGRAGVEVERVLFQALDAEPRLGEPLGSEQQGQQIEPISAVASLSLGSGRVKELEISALPNPISAVASLSLGSGRVKELEISALPNVLNINTRQPSQIRVLLRDETGNQVFDPTLRLSASIGTVAPPKLVMPGGYYQAQYLPPPVQILGNRARISVSNEDREYAGATEIQLIRSDSGALGTVRIGVISNLGDLTAPMLDFEVLFRMLSRSSPLYLGTGGGYYFYDVGVVRLDVAPLHLFMAYRYPIGRAVASLGLGPSSMVVFGRRTLATEEGVTDAALGWGLIPGATARLGLELGIGPGGLALGTAYSLYPRASIPSLGLQLDSSLGGISLMGGYVAHF